MVFGELGQRERGGDVYYAKKRFIQWYDTVQVNGQAAVVSTHDGKQASYATTLELWSSITPVVTNSIEFKRKDAKTKETTRPHLLCSREPQDDVPWKPVTVTRG